MQFCVHSFTLDAVIEGLNLLINYEWLWLVILLIASRYAAPFSLGRRLIQRIRPSQSCYHAPCDTCNQISLLKNACKWKLRLFRQFDLLSLLSKALKACFLY